MNESGVIEIKKFSSDDYPKLTEELAVLNRNIAPMPAHFKDDIVVSFLKDHSLMNLWIDANPELVKFITSGSVRAPQIESLFEAHRQNKTFVQGLEEHIRNQVLLPRE